jgi:hypothetical protein
MICSMCVNSVPEWPIGAPGLPACQHGQASACTGHIEENLPDDQAVLAAWRDHFGIGLNGVPEPAARHDLVS